MFPACLQNRACLLSEMVYCFSGVRLHVLIRARILAAVALLKGLDWYVWTWFCVCGCNILWYFQGVRGELEYRVLQRLWTGLWYHIFGITYRPYALLTICSTSISFPVLFWSKLLLGNPFGNFKLVLQANAQEFPRFIVDWLTIKHQACFGVAKIT